MCYHQVDHWLEFSQNRLGNQNDLSEALQYLDTVLAPVTYLVAHSITLADLAVWAALRGESIGAITTSIDSPLHTSISRKGRLVWKYDTQRQKRITCTLYVL